MAYRIAESLKVDPRLRIVLGGARLVRNPSNAPVENPGLNAIPSQFPQQDRGLLPVPSIIATLCDGVKHSSDNLGGIRPQGEDRLDETAGGLGIEIVVYGVVGIGGVRLCGRDCHSQREDEEREDACAGLFHAILFQRPARRSTVMIVLKKMETSRNMETFFT
jgi:hypothetical protein